MNERIKQLDKQAKLWAMDNTNFPISSHIPTGYTEKFAELIVRKCIKMVENEAAQYAEPVWAFELVNDIHEYFGVEE